MRDAGAVVLVLFAMSAGATCPPEIAFEYCQVGCEVLGRWVVIPDGTPLDSLQAQTATTVMVAHRAPAVVVRELAAAVEPGEWGWQWQVYAGPNAVIHAAVDAHTDGGHVVTTADGAVVRLWWKTCEETTRSRPARR